MTTASFLTFLDTTASTKRSPGMAGNQLGPPETNLASVTIVNPMPISPEAKQLYDIKASRVTWVSYAEASADILIGDEITVSGVFADAEVIAAAPWPGGIEFIELVISEGQ